MTILDPCKQTYAGEYMHHTRESLLSSIDERWKDNATLPDNLAPRSFFGLATNAQTE